MANRKIMLVVGGIAAVVLGAVGVGLVVYVLRDADAEVTTQSKDDPLQIAGAKMALEARFPDAQMSYGKTFVKWDGDIASVCGQVDIVEQQDSFDGEERYVFSDGALTVEQIDGTDALNQKWSDVCT
jgi:hypothetical protein